MKKALSLLLVLVMLIGMMPMQVFATEGTQETEAVEVVTVPTEAPEEETTAPTEETEPSEEEEKTESPDEEEETEPSTEEEEEEPSESSESEEEPEVVHEHDYEAVVTAPTCTEKGYTTYTCENCGDEYVDALGHTYENGICTGCGEAHPNLANLKGKVISIMGDSISTFAGYIPVADGFNLAHRARYPQSNLLTDVNETWWMQAITALDAKLGINDSWAGSRVANNITGNSGDYGENAAMASMTRILNLGANGTPDVILFYGGTNDIAYSLMLGSFNPATAPTEVDLTATKWNSAADAYVAAILRMQHFYPNAKIIAMLPTYTVNHYSDAKLAQFNEIYAAICEHYGVTCIDLRDCGITTADLPDGIHPDANGMDYITEAVLTALLEENMEPGETIVYSVKHTLTDVQASLGYYKGIRAGQTFAETLTGDNLTVTVMMGGEDITDTVYQNGEIRIASVTGDLVIMAKVQLTADGHLQQLPESFCSGTNLWTALKPENKYYTSGGWGNLPTNDVWSITIPVSAGDHIYASSFRKYGENGNNYSTDSGIRVTYFDANGALKTMTPTETYNAFKVNGYLTVPENVVAINIPMWTVSDENAVYILNKEHSYENGICAGCGDIRPVYEGHVQPLPDSVCSGMNLWNELEIRNGYYMETGWVDSFYSVTFAVSEGEQIWATSFQKVGINGGHVNGIRLTWFNGHGVIDSMEPAQVYDEFSRNGFLTAPAGAKYVNVVMWNNSDSNELYILNREHTYESVVTAPTCTEKGYTTYTCACGDTYTEEIAATGKHAWTDGVCGSCGTVCEHNYVDGTCEYCGAAEPEVKGTISDSARTISLDGVIYINQYVIIDTVDELSKEYIESNGGLLIWNSSIDEAEAVYTHAEVDINPGLIQNIYQGVVEYMGRTDGIPAKKYADEVYMRAYLELPDGTYIYGPLVEYSVQDYCEDKIANYPDEKLKDLCASLLHFGAAAQTFFKYNVDDPANANIIEDWPVYTYDPAGIEIAGEINTAITPSEYVENNGQTISLDGAIVANFYYKVNTIEAAKVELLIWNNVEGELTEANATSVQEMNLANGEYHAQSHEVAAKYYGKVFYACAKVTDTDGKIYYSNVIGYNPDTYAKTHIDRNQNKTLIELVKRMVVYSEYAKAYFNVA